MPEPGSYRLTGAHIDVEQEVQRLAAQVERSWAREARLLRRLGLEDGMTVLECGCGPGLVTERLEQLLPNSPILALDVDPEAIAYAQQRRRWRARTRFLTASITATGLREGQVDVAIARLVFQHLRQPARAATEVRRVLRPGGSLVVIESDDDLAGLVDPAPPELARLRQKIALIQALRGGDRRVGRKLWRILERAGYIALEQEAILTSSDAQGLELFLPQLDPARLAPLVREGLLLEEDLALARRAQAQLLAAAHPLVMELLLLVRGTKPAAPPPDEPPVARQPDEPPAPER